MDWIKCLKLFNFSKKQLDTDTQVVSQEVINKAASNKLELVEITQTNDNNVIDALLGENIGINNIKRNGLGNKFILYKPKSISPSYGEGKFPDDELEDVDKFMRSHAGLYYCDGKQNIYQLSPDYNFYYIVQQLLIEFDKRIYDLEHPVNEPNTEENN